MFLIVIFAFVQGFTEFLPVSSQGHLIFFNKIFHLNDLTSLSTLEMNIIAHAGSLLAVIFYYKDILIYWLAGIKMIIRPDLDRKIFLLINIITASIPLFFIGFFFAKYFAYDSNDVLFLIALMSIVFGILIYFIDKFCLRIKNIDGLNLKLSFVIGLFQCLALVPGVSRSGAIITSMRFLGFRREFAARFSNILSIPAILGALSFLIISSRGTIEITNIFSLHALIIFTLSFLFSIIFIFFFVTWVSKYSYSIFAIYRVIFGFLILMYIYI